MAFFEKIFGPRIDERIARFLRKKLEENGNLRFHKGKVVRIHPRVPGWGGRIAIVVGFVYSISRHPVAYDVVVEDPDDSKEFYRIAAGVGDNEVEEGVDPQIIESLKSLGHIKILAWENPLIHEAELF